MLRLSLKRGEEKVRKKKRRKKERGGEGESTKIKKAKKAQEIPKENLSEEKWRSNACLKGMLGRAGRNRLGQRVMQRNCWNKEWFRVTSSSVLRKQNAPQVTTQRSPWTRFASRKLLSVLLTCYLGLSGFAHHKGDLGLSTFGCVRSVLDEVPPPVSLGPGWK